VEGVKLKDDSKREPRDFQTQTLEAVCGWNTRYGLSNVCKQTYSHELLEAWKFQGALLTWQLLPLYSQDPYHVWNWSGIPPLTTTHLVHRSHFTLFNRQKCFQLTSDPYYHTRKKGTQAAHIPNSWGLFSTGQSSSSHCCQLLQEFPTRIKREINPLMVNCQNQVILKTDILKVNVSATEAPTRNRGTWLRTGKRYHCLV